MTQYNPWTRWSALNPAPALMVGEVISIADGYSTVQLPGGSMISAKGTTVPVGQLAYVRGGVVEGPAPELDQIEIEL